MAEGMRSGEGNTCILAPPRSAMAEGMRSGEGNTCILALLTNSWETFQTTSET